MRTVLYTCRYMDHLSYVIFCIRLTTKNTDPFELIHGPGDTLMHHGSELLIPDHVEELEVQVHEEGAAFDASSRLRRPVVGGRKDAGHVLIGNEGQATLQVRTIDPPFFQLCSHVVRNRERFRRLKGKTREGENEQGNMRHQIFVVATRQKKREKLGFGERKQWQEKGGE